MSRPDHDVPHLKLPRVRRPTTVKEQVYRMLRERLVYGHIVPNARIIEKDLTDQLGVSRTPVRETLARLSHEGLLIATRYGYKVPPFGSEELANVFEVRLLLEPTAARQAAEAEGDRGISEMRAAIEEEKAAHASGDLNLFLKAHMRFREAWLSRVRNPLLGDALRKALHSLQFIRRRTMSDSVVQSFIYDSHKSLFDAIIELDSARAEQVQRDTISSFHKLVMARVFTTPAEETVPESLIDRSARSMSGND